MDLKMATMVLAGSVIVHAAVTACTSATPQTASAEPTPACSCSAAPPAAAPEVSTEPCNKTFGGNNLPYAEHAYPGKTKQEIAAHLSVWSSLDNPGAEIRPDDYVGGLNLQSAVYTRDGFAGVGCRQGMTMSFVWSP